VADQPFPKQGANPHGAIPGARMSRIDDGMISRAAGFVRRMIGFGAEAERMRQAEMARRVEPSIGAVAPRGQESERPVGPSEVIRPAITPGNLQDGWFGPGQAMQPVVPRADVAGRQFDFPAGYNLSTTPRRFEGISFDTLRGLASYDLIRLAIETRKDQLARVKWTILPKKPPGQRHKTKADDNCRDLEKFWRRPDGVHNWTEWVRAIAEDALVLDAVALYRRRRLDRSPFAIEYVDPATISLLIDQTGRRPLPPNPAYQQVLKGMPAVDFTCEELTYSVRNPRSNKVYGLSPVEQCITYVNIGLRRMAGQLSHYTEGNIPEALISTPEGWTLEQISMLQEYWDRIMENPAHRRRAKFVPPGVSYWPVHGEGGAQLIDQFDEWLARIIAYAFSLPPTPFVRQMNRATAESAYDTALEEGLEPMLDWLKNLVDEEIADFCGEASYELVWDDIRKLDPTEKHSMDHADMQRGVKSVDDVRTERGDEPVGLSEPIFWGVGPLGFMSVKSVKKAIEQGLDMPQAPMPMDGMGMPPGADPLAGADPGLMAQFGLSPGAQGTGGAPPRPALPAPPGTPVGGPEEGGEGGDMAGSGETAMAVQPSPPVSLAAMLSRLPGHPKASATVRSFERRLSGRR
jgi:hypothetical protein